MLSSAGLGPLQVDKLRHKELRQRLLNLVGSIDREHAERPRRTVAAGLHLQGQIVEVINALSPRVEQRSNVIRQPETGENVLVSFARAGRKISLGDEQRHIGGNAV